MSKSEGMKGNTQSPKEALRTMFGGVLGSPNCCDGVTTIVSTMSRLSWGKRMSLSCSIEMQPRGSHDEILPRG
jgi:hypothetical protein